jgi:hypothetical protein
MSRRQDHSAGDIVQAAAVLGAAHTTDIWRRWRRASVTGTLAPSGCLSAVLALALG